VGGLKSPRYDSIDALRGVAIVWMTIFHFSFDLNWFGWIHQNFYDDPVWTGQRTAIVSLFLFCAGLGQAVAAEQAQAWPRFWKRWAQVAGCAVLVSIGSYAMFPRSFIYFGVLHGIALMLIVVRSSANWGRALWIAGAVAIAMKWVAAWAILQWPALDFLNDRTWNWLGLISRKPITEDYVPLIPWIGVMWWGMAAGQWLLAKHRHLVKMPMPKATAPLSWMGRWSLSWYMVHQPVLIGVLTLVKELSPRA
jgi:uncharacterized membrane protein